MLQKLKNKLKDQRGFTLIELLAVIVILGIIAAIAVPSILGLIDNTKKDAHVANAKQMVSSAQMAIASNSTLQSGAHTLTMGYLVKEGYLEKVESPEDASYDDGGDKADVTVTTANSYVKINNGKVIEVNLYNGVKKLNEKEVTGDSTAANNHPFSIKLITRESVKSVN